MMRFLLAALLLLGCGEAYVATNGRVYTSRSTDSPWTEALYASAAHDIACDRSELRIVANYVEHAAAVGDSSGPNVLGVRADSSLASIPPLAAVEGCGQRITYTVAKDRLVATNRVAVASE